MYASTNKSKLTQSQVQKYSGFLRLKSILLRLQRSAFAWTLLISLTTLISAAAVFETLPDDKISDYSRRLSQSASLSKFETAESVVPQRPAVEIVTATLVQTIDTSLFSPASPDPAGIAYIPARDRLLIVDSEVDETTGAGYHDVNMWEITRTGTVMDTGTSLAWGGIPNNEPTGADFDPATNTLFVSTDQPSATCRIYLIQPGADGRFGTADDGQRDIQTNPIIGTSSPDTEDPVFDPATGHLFFLNGQTSPVNPQVFRIDPVNGIFGDGDDTATHFDLGNGVTDATDAEGLALDEARNTLLVGVLRPSSQPKTIFEFSKDGTLLREINVSGITGLRSLSGLTMAPASNGSGRWNIWIVDRAVDNDGAPTENDGKLFEISVPPPANTPPVITSVTISPDAPKTNDVMTVVATGRDDDGNSLSYIYQWFKNGTALTGETNSTLDLSVTGNGDKGDLISVQATASDGTANSTPRKSAAKKVLNSAPVLNLPDLSNIEGASISISAAGSDADNDLLTYGASGLPSGLTINSATGLITGTIPAGASTNSPYSVNVTVRDPDTTNTLPIRQVQAITNNITASGVTSVTLAYSYAPTPGNLLIAEGRFGTGRTPTMPAGWVLAVANPENTSPRTVVFYKIAGLAEPQSVTLSASGTASSMSLTLFEYSGMNSNQSAVFDKGASNNSSSASSLSTGTTLQTTQPDELLIAGLHLGGSRTFLNTWTNGFRFLKSANYHEFAYRIVSTTGTFETTESWTRATTPIETSASMTLATFKAAVPVTVSGAEVTDTFIWIVTEPVLDNIPPVIAYTPMLSTSSNSNMTLTVDVQDNVSVDPNSVKIYYSLNGAGYLAANCAAGVSPNYECTIPGQPTGTAVAYCVSAEDTSHNLAMNTSFAAPNLYTVGAVALPAGTYTHMGLSNGASLGGNVFVIEELMLGGIVDTGANTLTLGCDAAATGAASNHYVVGKLAKQYCATGTFTYPVGTYPDGTLRSDSLPSVADEYTPFTANVTALTTNSSTLTVNVVDGQLADADPANSATRFWNVTETGDLTANISFTYLSTDVVGIYENLWKVLRRESGTTNVYTPGTVNPMTHTGTATGVTNFSAWGAGALAPTAGPATISGRVTTSDGQGIRNAFVVMSGDGMAPITVRTGTFGYFEFPEVASGRTYVLTVVSKRYTFSNPTRVLFLVNDVGDMNFVADPGDGNLRSGESPPKK